MSKEIWVCENCGKEFHPSDPKAGSVFVQCPECKSTDVHKKIGR